MHKQFINTDLSSPHFFLARDLLIESVRLSSLDVPKFSIETSFSPFLIILKLLDIECSGSGLCSSMFYPKFRIFNECFSNMFHFLLSKNECV